MLFSNERLPFFNDGLLRAAHHLSGAVTPALSPKHMIMGSSAPLAQAFLVDVFQHAPQSKTVSSVLSMLLLHVLLRATMWMLRHVLSAVLPLQLLSVQAGRRVGESLGAREGASSYGVPAQALSHASARGMPITLCTRAESVHTCCQRPSLFPRNHFTTLLRWCADAAPLPAKGRGRRHGLRLLLHRELTPKAERRSRGGGAGRARLWPLAASARVRGALRAVGCSDIAAA